MHPPTLDAPTSKDLRLHVISGTEWKVCDRRLPDRDPKSVLGFIERKGFNYEVTDLADPARITRCGSLASAAAAFCIDQAGE